MRVALVSTHQSAALAAVTVRHAHRAVPGSSVTVLDLDGTYGPVADEQVLDPAGVGISALALHHQAMLLEPPDLSRWLCPAAIRSGGGDDPVLAIVPGVILLRPPADLLAAAADTGFGVVSRLTAVRADNRWPAPRDGLQSGGYSPAMLAISPGRAEILAWWEELAGDPTSGDRWLDWLVSVGPHGTVRSPAALVSPWTLGPAHQLGGDPADRSLTLDGLEVTAVDLSGIDPSRPWLLAADVPADPRARLSDHPALVELVSRVTDELREARTATAAATPAWDPTETSIGVPVHSALRILHRAAHAEALDGRGDPPPDPFDPALAVDYRRWLTESPDGGPGRYLRAIHGSRPDLRSRFPLVPGEHTAAYLDWAATHATREPEYDAGLVVDAVSRAHAARPTGARRRLKRGVNVVGFLTGELGIGESARLMVSALGEAGIPHSAVPVEQNLLSRTADRTPEQDPARFATTLLCANADLAGHLTMAMPELMRRTYRIGMWYWEVEQFPETQHDGFRHVDEIWVATEFVRQAIEPHSPVPVLTVPPPLPQRGPEPTVTPAQLGVPDRDYFLFSFDFLSSEERKNPRGLIDAFTAAFRPGEGPVLVIKSINAHQRPAEAERLRLRAADEPDVVLLEEHLSPSERDALVASCACYVSLHRSEGLGLTIAEAMAWGRPVIATAYGGNLDFMTDENSYLVPWTPVAIPEGAPPYPPGGTWAQPDLAFAARAMRGVLDEPEAAARRGTSAAHDIATRHSPAAAGRAVAAVLARSGARRRTQAVRRTRHFVGRLSRAARG